MALQARPPYRNTKNRNRGRNGGNNSDNKDKRNNDGGRSGRSDKRDKSRGYDQRKKRGATLTVMTPTLTAITASYTVKSATGLIAVATTIYPPLSLTVQANVELDIMWTIDSGCTRHVTNEAQWFSDISTSGGSITVGGKNQIPIEGLDFIDSKGNSKTLTLHGVLYAPKLQFNHLLVPAAVKHKFRFHFDRKQCSMQTGQRFKIEAPMATNTDLYQFQAKPAANASALTAMTAVRGLGGTTSVNPKEQFYCRSCTLAKSHRAPFYSNRVVERARAQLQKVHTDNCGHYL
ncbi:LOW QUALITY PROTEIN: Hypothetical protein PHPALM_14314 [Phytophthora palmivora]|uniref:Retrovirus-related Pol polyprotein from transposon TNT 1-94-like beta-barrel domain-containing protein n=1 Tax=Phytophthora palmivora TaxID=4796 RepID=A0A2P4XV03_9STRA|nr:LOW QUALITY PROTEIN: Hypothetical protein PHPALM_14314 [Phytophthora palmivora]